MSNDTYWDRKYLEYWQRKVAEANQTTVPRAKAIPSDQVFTRIIDPYVEPGIDILDCGCGWGRMGMSILDKGANYYGFDISTSMVRKAKENLPKKCLVKNGSLEEIPFRDNQFDFAFALGVFDCTLQASALSEMLRIIKIGGKILITGKNENYFEDDDEARAAEIGARSKGEPNYFTNYTEMCRQISNNDQHIFSESFFMYRGDFAFLDNRKCERTERFYEYILVVEKRTRNIKFTNFSASKSKVCLNE